MKKFTALFFLVASMSAAHAADTASPASTPAASPPAANQPAAGKNATQAAEKKDESGLVTNVIGSQEAPTVLNVVSWKDKEVKLEKKSPTTSILNQVLQPLDRDVLKREVQYFRSLQEQK